MTKAGDEGSELSRRVTRRAVLASGATTVAGLAGLTGAGSARQITTTAVIAEPDRWADENLAGFMIHLGGTLDPVQTREAANCDYMDWPPDEIEAYGAKIIDRKQADTPEQDTELHISADEDVDPGALYLINQFGRCENGYIGVSLERIGQLDIDENDEAEETLDPVADVEEDERPNTVTPGSGAIGPGFGVVATIAGVVGAGLLARLRDD